MRGKRRLLPRIRLRERRRFALVGKAAAHNLGALRGVAFAANLHGQRESVEQLRAQLALLGVHRPDEDKARGMRIGNALALHGVDAHRRRVEQDVDDVILAQVYLVHIEDVAVRCGENARLELFLPLENRRLNVERPRDAILRRVYGQLHDAHGARLFGELFPLRDFFHAVGAKRSARRRTSIATAAHGMQRRQQRRERAHRR